MAFLKFRSQAKRDCSCICDGRSKKDQDRDLGWWWYYYIQVLCGGDSQQSARVQGRFVGGSTHNWPNTTKVSFLSFFIETQTMPRETITMGWRIQCLAPRGGFSFLCVCFAKEVSSSSSLIVPHSVSVRRSASKCSFEYRKDIII